MTGTRTGLTLAAVAGKVKRTLMDTNTEIQPTEPASPCTCCGACCAYYRCSFYWAEADCAPGGTVPTALTEKLNDFRRAMRGMSGSNPRCIALEGEIGKSVRCTIYDLRSSVCRDFAVAWENGVPNERCDKARLAWGLVPLTPPASPPPAAAGGQPSAEAPTSSQM